MTWVPVLDGALAAEAMGAVRDIAVALAAEPAEPSAGPAERALFWAYASPAIDEPFARGAYEAAIDAVIEELRGGAAHLALYGGLAGIGWTLCHVLDDGGDVLPAIDEALAEVLAIEAWPGAHDLIEGLAGIGVYFLERLEAEPAAERAREGLARVVAHLDANAARTDLGATWHTPPEMLPAFLAAQWPAGFYDVGVAHGAPGMIAVLDRAARLADAPAGAGALRDEALRWVTHQRLAADPDGRGRFPAKVDPARAARAGQLALARAAAAAAAAPDRARTAWCYGEPGIAAALWTAAPALALEAAHASAARPADACQVRDAGLCHGAAGLAHLHNRFYQATGEPAFAAAARDWIRRALAMRRPDTAGAGGWLAHRGGADDPPDEAPSAGFLDGAIGIGLALLAAATPAATPAAPGWDRLLCCELPRQPAVATTASLGDPP